MVANHSSTASLAMYPNATSSSIDLAMAIGKMLSSYAMVSMVGYPYQIPTKMGLGKGILWHCYSLISCVMLWMSLGMSVC